MSRPRIGSDLFVPPPGLEREEPELRDEDDIPVSYDEWLTSEGGPEGQPGG